MSPKKRLDENKIDALKFISQTHRSLHAHRIAHEIKIVITILTLYVLSVSLKISAGNKFPENSVFNICVWIVFLIMSIAASCYLIGSAKANKINQEAAEKAENKINELLDIDLFVEKDKHPNEYRVCLYIVVILVIAILSAFIFTQV